jgi:DNA repair protein RadC
MPITDWPAAERPREKLMLRGSAALSDAELIAIFLQSGRRGATAVDLARELLAAHGGLRPVLDCSQARLARTPGVGPVRYVQLQAALELGRRYLEAPLKRGNALSSPADTRRYLRARLTGLAHEVFACLFLDTRHRVIAFEILFNGTIDGTTVHPREVVKRALHHNAAALIFAHNHPSGVAEPSRADEQITRRLQEALALVDIRVLDHVITGAFDTVSLAERGLL